MIPLVVLDLTLIVKLNNFQCNESEFVCDSGACISLENRCDEVEDCEDRSDETHCDIVTIEDQVTML
jgi:Low-density lipoprotein receptor domain class A